VLRRMLALASDGRPRTVGGLARELGVTNELARSMLAGLRRLGYLPDTGNPSTTGCGACSMARSCTPAETRGRSAHCTQAEGDGGCTHCAVAAMGE